MNILDTIRNRRSIKRFQPQPVDRPALERVLEAAVHAPSHRMTEPWGFLVCGEGGKAAYGRVLARRRTSKVTDPEAAETVRQKTMKETMAVPVIVAVTSRLDENPEIREEDYAATWMAVQNLLLAAVSEGLGTHVKTGAIMDDPELREAWGVEAGRRVVAMIWMGVPEEVPAGRPRVPAAEKTTWID